MALPRTRGGCSVAHLNPFSIPPMPRSSHTQPSPDGSQKDSKKDPIYKHVELIGTSRKGIEDAVQKALKRARKTVKNPKWFQVIETRGSIDKGRVERWQVTFKAGFNVENS